MTAPELPSDACRRVLLTGASGGIGLATARTLAAAGVAVHAVVRSGHQAATVRAAILAHAPSAEVECHVTDLAVLGQVHGLVQALQSGSRPLDALVLNAAATPTREREMTVDGYERQFAVGHLSHFAIASGLLPMLAAHAGARVVVVASQVAYGATLDVDAVEALTRPPAHSSVRSDITGAPYHPVHVYGAVKLANVLFAIGLSRRLEATGGTAVCLHPGVVRTPLLDALIADREPAPSWIARAVAPVRGVVGRVVRTLHTSSNEDRWWDTPEEAAARIVAALHAPALRHFTGVFLQDGVERPLPELACDVEAVERLWRASERLIRQ